MTNKEIKKKLLLEMKKEDMQNLIRLVKSNADNNLILLKEILRLKKQVEELEKKESEVVNVV